MSHTNVECVNSIEMILIYYSHSLFISLYTMWHATFATESMACFLSCNMIQCCMHIIKVIIECWREIFNRFNVSLKPLEILEVFFFFEINNNDLQTTKLKTKCLLIFIHLFFVTKCNSKNEKCSKHFWCNRLCCANKKFT